MTIKLQKEWMTEFDLEENALTSPMADGEMQSPEEYIEAGVSPDTYCFWREINGFDIEAMLKLEKAGFSIEDLGMKTDAGNGGYTSTIAYKYCNNDLMMEEITELLNA